MGHRTAAPHFNYAFPNATTKDVVEKPESPFHTQISDNYGYNLVFIQRQKIEMRKMYDVVIIGGGPVGFSAAFHLAKSGIRKVAVVERDSTYTYSSAMLSAGGIRQQFSVPENIKMSMYGAQFLKNISSLSVDGVQPDVQFKEYGYLFLAGERSRNIIDQNHSQQVACGADWIKKYEYNELRDLFPWLSVSDLAVGTYSMENEGFFDPWLYLQALRRKAVSMGVDVINGSVQSARLSSTCSGSSSYNIDSVTVSPAASTSSVRGAAEQSASQLSAEKFINAAGAWSGKLVEDIASSANTNRHAGIRAVPVKPRKRCIFNIQCKVPSPSYSAVTRDGNLADRVPPLRTPLVVDPTGVYFRPEGNILGRFLAGVSPTADKDHDCSTSDFNALSDVSHELFEDTIWPVLYQRVPAFGELKVVSSWAGFYDYNTLDQNAIIGYHSEIRNLLLCTGFSGHGLQQSPAAGRAAAELVDNDGKFSTLDLTRFSFERVVDNKPIFETGIV